MIFAEELMNDVIDVWDKMVEHPFVAGMRDGTLDKKKFLNYMIQDTIYLKNYVKVYAWGLVKADDIDLMRRLYRDMGDVILDETNMHNDYLENLGWNEALALAEPMKPATKNYLDYMLDVSEKMPLEEGLVGLMPCALSYYYIACKIKEQAIANGTYENNYYKDWMDSLTGEGYKGTYYHTIGICELIARNLDDERKAGLFDIFRKGTQYEMDFWDMSYDA